MKLKAVYQTLEEIPEEYRELYAQFEDDGLDHIAEIEGITTKEKQNQFRSSATAALKENAALKEKLKGLEGLDPEKYKQMEAELLKIQDKKLIDEGKLEELLEQRTQRIKKDFSAKDEERGKTIDNQKAEIVKLTGLLTSAKIAADITTAVHSVGKLQKGALPDVQSRAFADWKLIEESGEHVLRAFDRSGTMKYGSEGKPLTPAEWAKDLAETAPHLFEGSAGSGARGDGGDTGYDILSSDGIRSGKDIADIASGKKRVR